MSYHDSRTSTPSLLPPTILPPRTFTPGHLSPRTSTAPPPPSCILFYGWEVNVLGGKRQGVDVWGVGFLIPHTIPSYKYPSGMYKYVYRLHFSIKLSFIYPTTNNLYTEHIQIIWQLKEQERRFTKAFRR